MKIANHKLYYGIGLSWDYQERLYEDKVGGNHRYCTGRTGHRPLQRYPKRTDWNKQVRSKIKSGVYDGIDLTKREETLEGLF